MVSPLTVTRNDYRKNKKPSTIYTPIAVAQFLYSILSPGLLRRFDPNRITVFDPAIGSGRLTEPWYVSGCHIVGCDIQDQGALCHQFSIGPFEHWSPEPLVTPKPDLVLVNPPFNNASGRKLFPEVFLRHIFDLFGTDIPVAMIVPMGMLLNQRRKSKRFRWLRDCGAQITSIISLPLDTFPGVEFHAEILIFNVHDIEPHYFLPEEAL